MVLWPRREKNAINNSANVARGLQVGFHHHHHTRPSAGPPATWRNSARVDNIASWCVTADETVRPWACAAAEG